MSKQAVTVVDANVPFKCHIKDDLTGTKSDFIYGGPFFVPKKKEDRFLDINTPTNVAHSGSFKRYVLRST